MKAAIIGYGKMGREIEKILLERGHSVALVIDTDNASDLNAANLAQADVALEFTMPTTAYGNIRTCIENATPVVSGTTGWTDRLPELQELCREKGGALFYASNYCLGVNLMFRLNRQLAEMIGRVGGYGVRIGGGTPHPEEGCAERYGHHAGRGRHRRPARQDGVGELRPGDRTRREPHRKPRGATPEQVVIGSVREGMVPGIHTVTYESEDDILRAETYD